MRIRAFCKRNFLELIRDPLSTIFAIILPLFLLFIFQQFDIPNSAYMLENFTPSIVIFGFSFITMFTSMLVAKDRSTSLLVRLSVSPMKTIHYVLGYALSVLPIVLLQLVLFFALALILGLSPSVEILYCALICLPISLLFIALGILIGSFTNEKSSSGVASIVIQLVAFTSGMWFSGDMLSKGFSVVCKVLPFESCALILKNIITKSNLDFLRASLTFLAYTLVVVVLALLVFAKKVVSKTK